MIKWGDGQSLAICRSCLKKLSAPPVPETYCAYYEVRAEVLRPSSHQFMPGPVDAATKDTADADKVAPPKSPIRATWDWLWDL